MDSVMEEDQIEQEIISQPLAHSNLKGFPAFQAPRSPVLLPVPPSSKMAGLNLNNPPPNVDPLPPLSLKLSLSESLLPPPLDQKPPPPARHSSGFQGMSGSFNNTSSSSGDSIISVA